MFELEDHQKEELAKYPELKALVDEYIATEGSAVVNESGEKQLPRLIVWMREHLEDDVGWDDMCEFLEWDEEGDDWEAFTSWGHNSRWANVFWPWVDSEFGFAVSVALALQHIVDNKEAPEGETL